MQPAAAPMQPMYGVAPAAAVPPEVSSIKSMLHIVRILAIIFGILLLLGGLVSIWGAWAAYALCTSVAGLYCGSLVSVLIFPILILIWGVIDFIIYMQMKNIEGMVDRGQYVEAKSKTMIWMILGFILGGVLVGIILLIAWLKFDPVINWQRSGGASAQPMVPVQPYQAAPAYGQPAPAYQQAPPAYQAQPQAAPAYQPAPAYQAPPQAAPVPAPAAAAPGGAPACRTCGKPTTWVPQYSRYYCYSCAQYA